MSLLLLEVDLLVGMVVGDGIHNIKKSFHMRTNSRSNIEKG
jgi:hypothetical protein